MFVTLARATLPFLYVRNYRYYPGIKVLSYFIGIFVPMMLYVYLNAEAFRLFDFILAWLTFWTFYEIGYLFNDCRSVAGEDRPTYRAPPVVCERFKSIVVFRCILLFAEFVIAARYTEIDLVRLAVATALTGATFTVHNTLRDYRYRFATLVLLSIFQPAFVIYVIGLEITPYIFLLIPYVALKYADYLHNKGMLSINLMDDLLLRWGLFTAWFGPVLMVGPEALYVYVFIYVNYTKQFYWEKLILTKRGRALAKVVGLNKIFPRDDH